MTQMRAKNIDIETNWIKYPDNEYQNVSDSSEGESSSAEIVDAQQVDANQQIANENRLFYRILTGKFHLWRKITPHQWSTEMK